MSYLMPELLNGLTAEESAEVLALGKRLVITSGAEIFHMGDDAQSLFVVQRGRVRLTLPMEVRGHDEDVLVEERAP